MFPVIPGCVFRGAIGCFFSPTQKTILRHVTTKLSKDYTKFKLCLYKNTPLDLPDVMACFELFKSQPPIHFPELVAKTSSIDVLMWLDKNDYPPSEYVFGEYAKNTKLTEETFTWFNDKCMLKRENVPRRSRVREENLQTQLTVMNSVAKSKHTDNFKLLKSKGYLYSTSTLTGAVEGGNCDIVTILLEDHVGPDYGTFDAIAKSKHAIQLMEVFLIPVQDLFHIIHHACRNNNLELVKWLYKKGLLLRESLIDYAAENDNIEMLTWLKANKCPRPYQAIRVTSKSTRKWLTDNGYEVATIYRYKGHNDEPIFAW